MLIKIPYLVVCLTLSSSFRAIITKEGNKNIYSDHREDPLLIGYAKNKYCKLFHLASPHKEFQISSLVMIFISSDPSQQLSSIT